VRQQCSFGIAICASVHAVVAQPEVVNGDFDGAIGSDRAPIGWDIGNGSPDVVGPNGPFNNTGFPWAASPNGGSFVRVNGVNPDDSESIVQTVSGFEIGQEYEIEFYLANLGFQVLTDDAWNGSDGTVQIFGDGTLLGESQVLSRPDTPMTELSWEIASFSFIAAETTVDLEISPTSRGFNFQPSYFGVDGLSIALIPVPATFWFPAIVGYVIGGRRR
jgi:hypothetical protein